MQCENGYTKPGVKGILCRKAEEPKAGDLRSVAHAMCGHQRFCPNARCYQFLPGWEKCTMRDGIAKEERSFDALALAQDDTPIAADATAPLAQGSQAREGAAGEEMPAKKGKRTAKKKCAEKGADGE